MVASQRTTAIERIIVSGIPLAFIIRLGHVHDSSIAMTPGGPTWFTLPSIRVEAGRRRLNYRGVSLLNDTHVQPGTVSFRAEVKEWAKAL